RERGCDLLDLIRMERTFVQRGDLPLHLAQVEEQPLLGGGRADLDETPGAQDVFLNGSTDPPHRIGREAEPLIRLEALDRVHEADVALGDYLRNGQAVAAITHGDLGDETQV